MNAVMILTQASGALHWDAVGALGAANGAASSLVSAEGGSDCALLQFYDDGAPWPGLSTLPEQAGGTNLTRYAARLVSDTGPSTEPAPVLMVVAFDVPSAVEDEVERWYAEEHIPMLMCAPGWLRARRYQMLEFRGGPRFTSIALHELRDLEVLKSRERALARATPWRARLEQSSWFQKAGRFVYRRLL